MPRSASSGRCLARFFSTDAAADQLGVNVGLARVLLRGMQRNGRAVRVCRDGWVITWNYRRDERDAPLLTAYVDDMMKLLGVGYYLSYAAAAKMRGAAHHGVMRMRVNVETDADAMDALELRQADGPVDLAVSFHRIDPQHGRPVAIMGRLCRPPTRNGSTGAERRIVRVATMETILLDMMERPDRCGGLNHIATIAVKMLFWRHLHPRLLAEAAEQYEPRVAQRTGSMLQQIRGIQHRINLRPLMHHVRSRENRCPVNMHTGEIDTSRKADRWGVTHERRLDPDL